MLTKTKTLKIKHLKFSIFKNKQKKMEWFETMVVSCLSANILALFHLTVCVKTDFTDEWTTDERARHENALLCSSTGQS